MKNFTLIKLFTILQLVFVTSLSAQWQIGLQGGRNFAEGDAHCWEDSKINPLTNTGVAFGAFAEYLFKDKRLGTRLHYSYIPLKFDESRYGSVAGHATRAYKGKNKASDLSLELVAHLLRKKRLHPYLFGGVGLQFAKYDILWNAATRSTDELNKIKEDQQHGNTNFILPVGGGLQYRVNDRLGFHAESSMRLPVSDYYDGISISANPDANDWYGYGMLGLTYLLRAEPDADKDGISDKKDQCPDIVGIKAFDGCPDSDNDGIKDGDDRCPFVEGPANYKGCPDGDGDGTPNIDDECPTVKGLTALKGCPDGDGDGVTDTKDDCPDVFGLSNMKGCPDTDGDNIADKNDDCPREKGASDMKGCPDTDGDGVANKDDKCPSERGLKTNNGCPPPDGDKDGVADSEDKCPTEAGLMSNNGCPEVKVDAIATSPVVIPSNISTPGTSSTNGKNAGSNTTARGSESGASTSSCAACATGTDPIFNGKCVNPKKLSRLGTNPEFGNSHGLSATEFFEKLTKAYKKNKVDRVFLDRIFKGMGYSGFADARADMFSEVVIPQGTSGQLGYSKLHKTGCYTLPDSEYDRQAFRIEAMNGCTFHFMKTCGNHFFFCN
jgi:opacity protein-like surface antigen